MGAVSNHQRSSKMSSATICCGCNAYKLSKTTTIAEMFLTCNCLLFLEYYGTDKKKKMFVILGIMMRLICLLINVIMAILFFAWSGYFLKILKAHHHQGDEYFWGHCDPEIYRLQSTYSGAYVL